jgi:hypothetical protein
VWYTSPHIDEDTKDIHFTEDHMVTKAEFNEAVEKLDDRVTAVESKIGGIHNRIDDEALKRENLESRVRSVVPNLPPPPEHVYQPPTKTDSPPPSQKPSSSNQPTTTEGMFCAGHGNQLICVVNVTGHRVEPKRHPPHLTAQVTRDPRPG